MPGHKRGRACDACHAIKIKCELGSTGGDPPCTRCVRLGKDCLVSAPVRHKDRVAELEAKLETLTKLLEAQKIQTSSSEVSESVPQGGPTSLSANKPKVMTSENSSKKRRLEASSSNDNVSEGLSRESPSEGNLDIDHLIPRDIQIKSYDMFCNEAQSRFPVASLTDKRDYINMRERYPILLQAIVFATSQGKLSIEVQAEITKVIINLLVSNTTEKAKKSLELVQAFQVATFWYRPPVHDVHVSLKQMIHLSVTLAEEICIDKFTCPLPSGPLIVREHNLPGDGWRTWISCYILSACTGVCIRIPHQIAWHHDDEVRLCVMEYSKHGLTSDRLLCQLFRGERLCEQVARQTGCYGSTSLLEVTDLPTMQLLRNYITDWKAQIPSSLNCLFPEFYEYLASILLNECVLHTPTNKQSFAAPYVAERLSVTDFPAPIITQEHILSIHALRDATHMLLDLYTSFDLTTLTSMPLIFTSRAAYAEWILVKLFIATTAVGNTYGAFISVQSLRVEHYLDKMFDVGEKLAQIDEGGGPTRIMHSVERLREWIWNYNTSHINQGTLATNGNSDVLSLDSKNLDTAMDNIDWTSYAVGDDAYQYGFEDLFGES